MIYLQLFLSFLQIGALSFGGGYASVRLIQNQVVDLHHWISMTEFTDIITISQMTPGPVAINSATFVGIKIAGIPGALIATLGCALPSCVIVLILARFYYKYRQLNLVQGILALLRPAVVAMIGAAGLSILMTAFFGSSAVIPNLENTDAAGILLFAAAFFVLRKWKINPIWVMMGCGLVGMAIYPFLPA